MRIAFFGGSFDPPHFGHLAISRAALQALNLDRVLFAPVGFQPLKPLGSAASFADRVEMTRLAVQNEPGFEVSLADAPADSAQPAPNYTFDTLTALRRSQSPEIEWFLLLGADAFHSLPRWHRAAEIPFLADLIVASRPGAFSDAEDLDHIQADFIPGIRIEPVTGQPTRYRLTNLEGEEAQLTILPNLDYEVSATQLRNQIHGSSSESPQIPAPVLDYIQRHHLYR
jgi:nicotinate-nucleotide adenylyltransferase